MKTIYATTNIEAANAADEIYMLGEGLVIFMTTEYSAVYGSPLYISKEACDRHGIFTWQAKHIAGTIVSSPGDLNLCEIVSGTSDLGPKCMEKMHELIPDSIIDGNDLMVNGKKAASWGSMRFNGKMQTTVHFSVNLDLDLISEICTKSSVKEPGTIGYTAEEIVRYLFPNN